MNKLFYNVMTTLNLAMVGVGLWVGNYLWAAFWSALTYIWILGSTSDE